MRPLIDGDILVYEIASCGEWEEQDEQGETVKLYRDFDFVADLLDERINGICKDVDATEPPLIFLTGNSTSTRITNRRRKLEGLEPLELITPYREEVATVKPYKGTRKTYKPFHYKNVTAYLMGTYECVVSNGLEADDLMAVAQCGEDDLFRGLIGNIDTVICSRDKDLRMVPGWHFGWECGKQPSFGPELVDNRGWLKDVNGTIKGVGLKFFFYQMLIGDTVDNIPGCPKVGPVKALKLLEACTSKADHEAAVRAAYEAVYGDEWKERLEEQSKLLWMAQKLNEDGSPVYYDWSLNELV